MSKLDTAKITYIIRAVLLYWLGIGAFLGVIYGVGKLSTPHQVDFGIALLFVTFSAFIGWMAASHYKSKLDAQKWQKEREERQARYRPPSL
jgi:hypothetical protein